MVCWKVLLSNRTVLIGIDFTLLDNFERFLQKEFFYVACEPITCPTGSLTGYNRLNKGDGLMSSRSEEVFQNSTNVDCPRVTYSPRYFLLNYFTFLLMRFCEIDIGRNLNGMNLIT